MDITLAQLLRHIYEMESEVARLKQENSVLKQELDAIKNAKVEILT